MTNLLVADVGAGRTKITTWGRVRNREGWVEYAQPSYAVQLTRDQWDAVRARNLHASGYALINDVPFAFGYTARQYTTVRPEGVTRYTRDYLGAVVAYGAVMVGLSGSLTLVVMHPPSAVGWRDAMLSATAGNWAVTTFTANGRAKHHTVNVANVTYLDEPLGGLNNVMLSTDGKLVGNIAKIPSVMTVDVGAHTTDVAVILERDLLAHSLRSVQIGVNALLNECRAYLRSEHHALMTSLNNPDIDDARLFSAFQDSELRLGAHIVDLRPFLATALTRLTNDVSDIMRSSEYNLANALVITGGGGALLQSHLRVAHTAVFKDQFYLADNPNAMQFANARGAYKLANALAMRRNRRKGS